MANVQELKAQAYDLLANIEFLQSKLREVNMTIAEETRKEQENGSKHSHDSN
jgi:prefoldin subunit 5